MEKIPIRPSQIFYGVLSAAFLLGAVMLGVWIHQWMQESKVLKQMVERLSADSRVAEVLVTKSEFDEVTKKIRTTIKFLEFDSKSHPLTPKYFTFNGNMIQFQSLVVRFEDKWIRGGDALRGKSVYLFLKAFVLDGTKTQEFEMVHPYEVPEGYRVEGSSDFQKKIWAKFWTYALDPKSREGVGIKNAQLEAPGSIFIPGTIYTLKIEHDGGLRIDTAPIPPILKGEKL